MKNKIVYDGQTFTPTDIKSGQLHLAASLPSMKLEPNTLTAVVKSEDTTLTEFTRNTPLYYYRNDRSMIIAYVQSVDRIASNKYKLYGTSAVGRLIEQPHAGGIYTGQLAPDVIQEICGSVPCIVKSSLNGIKLYGWLPYASPPKRSARDNLAQVLFAIGATLKTDLDGVLRIEGLWDGVSGEIPRDKMYTDAAVDYEAKITRVIVTEHQYIPWTEEKQLFEGTAQAGDVITFDEPMHSLTAEGFTIQASGANWARLSAGSGTLKGRTYLHNTRQVSQDVGSADTPNIKTVEDATLVSLVNSSAVVNRLAAYYRQTQTIDASVIYEGNAPGDVISAYHPFDRETVSACLESADITLSNTLKAKAKMRVGYLPPQIGESGYFDFREVLDRDGTWTVPDGVTDLTVVCIGGAWGGWSGERGGQTEKRVSYNYSRTSQITGASYNDSGYCASVGGAGGEAGAGGSGGKILQASMKVTPGQKISCKIGVGGAGGRYSASGSQAGAEGTPSVFGALSSASGASSPTGYLDIITGELFAATGEAGISGGNGSGGPERAPEDVFSPAEEFFLTGASVTDRQGRVWTPARSPKRANDPEYWDKDWKGDSVVTSDFENELGIVGSYGLSGGAAVGANGVNGPDFTDWSVYKNGTTLTANGTAAPGGKGANASAPGKQGGNTGTGGPGGNGGGGAGGSGEVFTSTSRSWNASSATFQKNISDQFSSAGPGNGSNGGSGGDGCIILYYRQPKEEVSGRFLDRRGRDFLDMLSRRIIV